MKKTLTLIAILSFVSCGVAWSGSVMDNGFYLEADPESDYPDCRFSAIGIESGRVGDGALESIYLSSDGTEHGAALDLTDCNLYFYGSGTTSITGVNLENTGVVGDNNTTKTSYAFVVAEGSVEFNGVTDDGSAVDLQQNISVGTAWTNRGTVTLTIQEGSKIATTACYNTVGSNGTTGIINILGAEAELKTQQITLGGGTAGMTANITSTGTPLREEGSTELNWYPEYFYDSSVKGDLASVQAEGQGYGIINIRDGASMTVGEGNSVYSNSRLQIYNGEVNVGKDASLILSEGIHLSMASNYTSPQQVLTGLKSFIHVEDGGRVEVKDGGTLGYLCLGQIYKSHELEAGITATGVGSTVDLTASKVDIGGLVVTDTIQGEGGASDVSVLADAGASIHIKSLNNIQLAVWDATAFNPESEKSHNKVTVSATGGGTVELAAGNQVLIGYYESDLGVSLVAEDVGSVLEISGKTITVNGIDTKGVSTEIKATGGGEVNLKATASTYLGPNTHVEVSDSSKLNTTGMLTLYGETATAYVDKTSSWEAGAVILKEQASIVNEGDMTFSALYLQEGTSFINRGKVTMTSGAVLYDTSSTTFTVSGDASSSLTSTLIALENAPLTLQAGAEFVLDFTGASVSWGTLYEDVYLTLVTGISNPDRLTEDALATLLGNTDFAFVNDWRLAEDSNLYYEVVEGDANSYNLVLRGDLRMIPEPATATLSLLALAALAARRRRQR